MSLVPEQEAVAVGLLGKFGVCLSVPRVYRVLGELKMVVFKIVKAISLYSYSK